MEPRKQNQAVCAALTLFMLLLSSCSQGDSAAFSTALPDDVFDAGQPGSIGIPAVAATPRHFPNPTDADIKDMMPKVSSVAKGAVMIYQWGDPSLDSVPATVIGMAKDAGLIPIVGLSPTSLDQGRKELDVPKKLHRIIGSPSFGDDDVRKEFIKAAKDLASLHPPYLCLATEINVMGLQRIQEYVKFAGVYKEAYKAVKEISPQRPRVFVSFQYEFIRIVDNKDPGKIDDHAKMIDLFRPELDMIAITSYPGDYYPSPGDMPSNYYAHLKKYLHPDDQVMVMEIGWPSTGKGTPEAQAQFIQRLPVLLGPISPKVTAWALLHDVRLSAFGQGLASTGLLSTEGETKPALKAWQDISAAH